MQVDWGNIAPMIVGVTLIVTVGGVMVLRPIAKKLGGLMELYARDKQSGVEMEVHQLRDVVETMNARLQLMEERQDFTERLLAAPKGKGASIEGPHDKEKNDG
jgi:hypothetical protein